MVFKESFLCRQMMFISFDGKGSVTYDHNGNYESGD